MVPRRQRASHKWVHLLLSALAVALVLAACLTTGWLGFRLGSLQPGAPPWDPLVLRAYAHRPVDDRPPGAGFWVTGYWVDYDDWSDYSLRHFSPHLDQVILTGFELDERGLLHGPNPWQPLGLVHRARTEMLVANAGFRRSVTDALLSNAAAQETAIAQIRRRATVLGVAGVQLDLENVAPGQRRELTRFVTELAAGLHADGRTLSMAVPAQVEDDPHHDWSGAFDYAALGAVVDRLFIMAYDEHWVGGPPGPVASLPWVEQVVRHALAAVPSGKLILGVPAYGYEWGPDGGQAYGVGPLRRRLEDVGAEIRWDPVLAENVATYRTDDGAYVAWFPDRQSLEAKVELAQRYRLRGVALWRLGLEPDAHWEVLSGIER